MISKGANFGTFVSVGVLVLCWVHFVECQDVGDYDQIDNPAVIPLITQIVYGRISNVTAVLSRQISNRSSFCVKNPEADWNEAFNFSSNVDFLTSCIQKTKGDVTRRLCTAAEMKFYFNSFFEKSETANYLRPNKNCNLTSWISGCEPGWACRVGPNEQVDLENSQDIPARTQSCQPCCEGFFCPHGLTCMISCPSGSYCPQATLNKSTGVCEPYNYQLPPGQPNHTCGGANLWADVGTSSEVFCSAGSYCPTTVKSIPCSSGYVYKSELGSEIYALDDKHYCRMVSTSEKRCFALTSCNPNTANQNMHAYGIMLIAGLSTLLLIIYNCSDQVLTTRGRKRAKSREAAARSARETAKARQRWKSAKDAAKKHASGLQAHLSRTFSRKKDSSELEKLKMLTQSRSDTDDDLLISPHPSRSGVSQSSPVPSEGKKKEPTELMQIMHKIEEDPEGYEGFSIGAEDTNVGNVPKGKMINTHSQIFKYAYGQLEKEKAQLQEYKDLTFSGVVKMATNNEIRKRPLIEISFKDLTLTLKAKNKHLLRCVTGKIRPGRITAVMDDVISHMGAWSNTSLSRHKTCMEAFEGTNSILAGGLKQVTTSIHGLLGMLHAHQTADFVDSIRTSKHITPWLQRPNFVVSHDGSGDFKLISDAIAAAPDHSRQYFVIFVKRGVYYEYVNIDAKKSNLVLVGEGMDNTIISGNRSNGTGWGTSDSATFTVKADGFIAVNIGFVNTAGPYKMQAVALRSQGDRSAFFQCSISGYQDTLLVHDGRQFFRMCKISGTVDFIFGYGTAVFQKCTIISKQNGKGGRNEITAHGRFNQNDPTGFSFQFCNIVYDNSHGTVSVENQTPTYLGRPWGNCSRTIFMQSQLDAVIRPEGWHEWSGDFGLKTLYYGEYMNEGLGSNLSHRVKWPGYHVITDPSVADQFTVAKFIGGNSWLPSTGIPYAPGLLKDR
ncbi:hypothetical protein C1H46_038384 [Malus baccata]|uniref:Pectinesterase catalytic domain-containing protein n=1 Tax=Malus baccata TaxID=106549 RepID=A0A540KPY7_MALBA|nr:hypothetical protein C1H46_038384 [Malus baccata]